MGILLCWQALHVQLTCHCQNSRGRQNAVRYGQFSALISADPSNSAVAEMERALTVRDPAAVSLVAAGIAFKAAKSLLEDKYLRSIADYSDEMRVARYNEAKADHRAAALGTDRQDCDWVLHSYL